MRFALTMLLALSASSAGAATIVWEKDGTSIVLTKYNRGWMPRPTWRVFTNRGAVALIGLKLPNGNTCAEVRPWTFRLQVVKGGETRWLESTEVWLHDGPAKFDRWKHSPTKPVTIAPDDDDPAPEGWIRLHVVVPRLPDHEQWQIMGVQVDESAWEVKECDTH